MAQIDVTELLSDPDFVDPVTHISRTSLVNGFGEQILGESSVQTFGSVQPASGKVIQRLPEELRVANLSSFWLKGKILVSEPGKYTDILVFNGRRYQVQMVFDWMNWGEGWCEGTCVAEVPAP
jgi:hypothetical protein